jgi:hypothetical protein
MEETDENGGIVMRVSQASYIGNDGSTSLKIRDETGYVVMNFYDGFMSVITSSELREFRNVSDFSDMLDLGIEQWEKKGEDAV